MDIKPKPNRQMYMDILRKMTPAQRLDKAFELSEFSRRLFIEGLRKRFPDATEDEFKNIVLKRLKGCHDRKMKMGKSFIMGN